MPDGVLKKDRVEVSPRNVIGVVWRAPPGLSEEEGDLLIRSGIERGTRFIRADGGDLLLNPKLLKEGNERRNKGFTDHEIGTSTRIEDGYGLSRASQMSRERGSRWTSTDNRH
jgi:hypothetical protein